MDEVCPSLYETGQVLDKGYGCWTLISWLGKIKLRVLLYKINHKSQFFLVFFKFPIMGRRGRRGGGEEGVEK